MTAFHIGFYGWPVYIAICILYNYVKIERWKINPRYFVSNQWRAVFGFIATILMTVNGFDGFDPAYLRTWILIIPSTVYVWSSFYLFFDLGLNALRGKKWNYRGKASGWLDRSKIIFYYGLKCLCLTGLVYSLIALI